MIVPVAGAGSSMSTLSVEISTTVSPSLTASPTLTAHSRIVPSVTLSPPVGVTMSITRGGTGSPAGPPVSLESGTAPASSAEISASTAPTATVSPSAA